LAVRSDATNRGNLLAVTRRIPALRASNHRNSLEAPRDFPDVRDTEPQGDRADKCPQNCLGTAPPKDRADDDDAYGVHPDCNAAGFLHFGEFSCLKFFQAASAASAAGFNLAHDSRASCVGAVSAPSTALWIFASA